jgi:hypothetical protein
VTHPSVTYGNGARINVTSPFLNGDNVIFTGTSAATEPLVYLDDGVVNTLNSLAVTGHSASALAFGEILIYPPNPGNLVIANGIHLSYGDLTITFANGGSATLNGISSVTNNSTFDALGGRYQADPYILNGSLTVSNHSTADFSFAPLQGGGTVDIETGATVDVSRVAAGLNIDLNSGTLVASNTYGAMSFLGTIHEAAAGTTDVLNATTAVKEVLHASTGMLDLLDQAGTTVAALKFAGASTLYTTPDGHGGMDITTTHHTGSLPTVFLPN